MPNKNYLAGRRLEYEVIRLYKEKGAKATRTAGSHGWCDVIALFAYSTFPEGFKHVQSVGTESDMLLERTTRKYYDRLFIDEFRGDKGTVHLIQCKRKKVE